jgi:hypothetical protein
MKHQREFDEPFKPLPQSHPTAVGGIRKFVRLLIPLGVDEA